MSCIVISNEIRNQIEEDFVQGNQNDPNISEAILNNLIPMNNNSYQIPLTFENAAYLHNRNLGHKAQVRIKKSDLQQLLALNESLTSNFELLFQNQIESERFDNFCKKYPSISRCGEDAARSLFNKLTEEEKKQFDTV